MTSTSGVPSPRSSQWMRAPALSAYGMSLLGTRSEGKRGGGVVREDVLRLVVVHGPVARRGPELGRVEERAVDGAGRDLGAQSAQPVAQGRARDGAAAVALRRA